MNVEVKLTLPQATLYMAQRQNVAGAQELYDAVDNGKWLSTGVRLALGPAMLTALAADYETVAAEVSCLVLPESSRLERVARSACQTLRLAVATADKFDKGH